MLLSNIRYISLCVWNTDFGSYHAIIVLVAENSSMIEISLNDPPKQIFLAKIEYFKSQQRWKDGFFFFSRVLQDIFRWDWVVIDIRYSVSIYSKASWSFWKSPEFVEILGLFEMSSFITPMFMCLLSTCLYN